MATARTRTLLPLDRFAAIIGMSPLHFNQVVLDELDPSDRQPMMPASTCGQPLLQYSWQDADRVGREEIAQAIADAEAAITRELGYSPGPRYILDERVDGLRFPWMNNFYNLVLSQGYVISGGREAKTLLANRPIVYSDDDGDGYDELATVTIATTVTSPDEIAVFYPDENGVDAWEIRPINVDIAAGTATITFSRHQAVAKNLLEAFVTNAVDGMVDSNFLGTVDIYRRYIDPSQMLEFLGNISCPNCIDATCVACVSNSHAGCFLVQDARLGIVAARPATWDADNSEFRSAYACYPFRSARVWYKAGLASLSPEWERAITYYALTFLDRPLCGCEALEAYTKHWKDDLTTSSSTPSGGTQTFRISTRLLDSPFGTTRGGIHAWRMVQRAALGV